MKEKRIKGEIEMIYEKLTKEYKNKEIKIVVGILGFILLLIPFMFINSIGLEDAINLSLFYFLFGGIPIIIFIILP